MYGKSYCGGKVHHSDFNHCAKYHFHLLIISNRRFRQLTMSSLEEPKEKSVSRQYGRQERYGKSYCGENVHYSDLNEYAKYHLHCVIISNGRCRQLMLFLISCNIKNCTTPTLRSKRGILRVTVMGKILIKITMMVPTSSLIR